MMYINVPILIILSVFIVTGCGHSSTPSTVTAELYSDDTLDGDIELTSSSTIVTRISSSVQTVFAGVDPISLNESRAFLFFHLNSIPSDAIIDDATLDIYIDSISSETNSVPISIDLLSLDHTDILSSDFSEKSQPALATITIFPQIALGDSKHIVSIDVTALMQVAQNLNLNDFQVRILEDLNATSNGIIEIDDRTTSDSATYAPYLAITYH